MNPMESTLSHEIYSSRSLNFPLKDVYHAFAHPQILKLWWGPNGFTNTIHEFDLRAGGNWKLTMHGPDKGNYQNSSVFQDVQHYTSVRWTRLSQPLFDMEIAFEEISENVTNIQFRMIFEDVRTYQKMKDFVIPNNEENFDRLEKLLTETDVSGLTSFPNI